MGYWPSWSACYYLQRDDFYPRAASTVAWGVARDGCRTEQLFAMTLGESLVVGLVASVCGVLLGIGLAGWDCVLWWMNDLAGDREKVTQLICDWRYPRGNKVLGTPGPTPPCGIGPA